MEWYIKVLKNYVTFTGRARRKEYWMFTLFNIIVSIVLSIITGFIGLPEIAILYSLAVFLPSIAVAIRRLHDTGRSGWWLLISFVPFIGIIILIIFTVQESHEENQYGENPKLVEAE